MPKPCRARRASKLTEIDAAPEGDTIMPAFDPSRWQEVAREAHPADGEKPGYSFVTLVRRA
jgi:dihydrofolate reductase